ncbi:outer membrane beta-barrel protein [Niabella insulamsoli]|uniref:outer membrane beta-barrel protein n=1 Tax=Niabella insulamsoli TaxID=3144874 RepID=UPI0031FDC913
MKKILFAVCAIFLSGVVFAQVDTSKGPALVVSEPAKKPKKKYNLTNRANDHFLLQLGYTNWLDAPDSIQTKGLSRSINAYFMMDFPFKSSQQLSAAVGLGVGSDHVFLDNAFADVKGRTNTMRFNGLDTTIDVKKTKVTTAYAELPVELRYTANPEASDKSFKIAVGVKVGTMLKGGTRSRLTEPTTTSYLLKESSKNYFNTTRIVGTARVGVGHFTVFGTYQFTSLLKAGVGPQLKPFTIGLTFGGL